MKKLISLALLGASTSLFAIGAEHSYLYKDARIMGMGGVNVAVGSYSSSVFANPAGLASIKKEDGFVVDILGIGVELTSNIQNFVDDLDAADTDSEVLDVIGEYDGTPFHIGMNNYTSISKNSDLFAWSIGFLAGTDANFMAHSNNIDAPMETSIRGYGGMVLGFAKPFDTCYGKLDIGVGLKYIQQSSYEGLLLMNELTDDDIGDTLEDKVKDSSGFGLDMGLVYHPLSDNFWHPTVGMSILNIGSMDMDDSYGQQPMTVNIGASVAPEVQYIDKLVLAVDYVDLLDANKVRFYNADGTYDDLSESDPMKRLRVGLGIGLIDTMLLSTTLNVGMYQGSYTAGVDLELLMFKLNLATYEEEVGTGSASNKDRRYMLQFGIGW